MYFGKTAHVRNFSSQPVSINYINNINNAAFAWKVDPWTISLPYTVASGDSLGLTVKISIPDSRSPDICDTLFVNTDARSHTVAICVDPSLLTQISELQAGSKGVRVYPNPVANAATFEYSVDKASSVRLDILALDGKVVCTPVNETREKGLNVSYWLLTDGSGNPLPDGMYFYRFRIGEKVYSGKISVAR
jgi:hypothetical protein